MRKQTDLSLNIKYHPSLLLAFRRKDLCDAKYDTKMKNFVTNLPVLLQNVILCGERVKLNSILGENVVQSCERSLNIVKLPARYPFDSRLKYKKKLNVLINGHSLDCEAT